MIHIHKNEFEKCISDTINTIKNKYNNISWFNFYHSKWYNDTYHCVFKNDIFNTEFDIVRGKIKMIDTNIYLNENLEIIEHFEKIFLINLRKEKLKKS